MTEENLKKHHGQELKGGFSIVLTPFVIDLFLPTFPSRLVGLLQHLVGRVHRHHFEALLKKHHRVDPNINKNI